MKMKRGQAFDTMMLVISVIVAVAILAILLQFLKIPLPGSDAKSDINSLMTKVHSAGYGLEIDEKVTFSNTDTIFRKDAIGGLSVATDNVDFACVSGSQCSAESDPLTVSSPSIVGHQSIEMVVAVCIKPETGKYLVAVGQSVGPVREYASSSCGLS